MNKKPFIAVCFLLIVFSTAFANVVQDNAWKTSAGASAMLGQDIKEATGYDWQCWTRDQKILFMTAMFSFYELDLGVYSVENAVDLLDTHYYAVSQQQDDELSDEEGIAYQQAPCLLTFGGIVGDEESDWGINAIRKDSTWNTIPQQDAEGENK